MAIALYNSGVMQVTGTASAATLRSLMNTASAGKGDAVAAAGCNIFNLSFEGTARFTLDGQDPTTTVGLQGAATTNASNQFWRESSVDKIKIIGNTVKINVQCGWSNGSGY